MQSEQWYKQSSVCGGVQGNKGEGGWNFPSRTETSPTSPEEFLSFPSTLIVPRVGNNNWRRRSRTTRRREPGRWKLSFKATRKH